MSVLPVAGAEPEQAEERPGRWGGVGGRSSPTSHALEEKDYTLCQGKGP
jgi:hypothetical protein